MDGEPVTKWSHILWEIKSFPGLRQHIQKNCSVQGLRFDMILQQFIHPRQFILSIDEIPPSPDAVKEKEFYVTSYIIDRSEEQHFRKTNEVTFTGKRKSHNVWNAAWKEIINKYLTMLVENDTIWLITIFEPKCLIQVRLPESPLSKDPWNSLDNLSRDFCSLIDIPGDFSLKCKSEGHLFHRNILVARCGKLVHYQELFPKTGGELDLDESCFDYFMEYVYCGCFHKIKISDAVTLYNFGLQYQIKDLMALCSNILTTKLTKENAGNFLLLAHNSKDEHFKEAIAENILRRNIFKSKEWISFSRQNMELTFEVYWIYAERLKKLYLEI